MESAVVQVNSGSMMTAQRVSTVILMEAMMDVPSNVVRETFSWQIPEMEDHGDVSVRMRQDPIK